MLYNKQKRLNNEYIQKLCTLLNTNDKQYTLKRTHLNELEYKIDDNNNLYLTGLKFNNIDNPKKKYNDEEDYIRRKNIFLTKNKTVEIKRDFRNEVNHDLFSLVPEFAPIEEQLDKDCKYKDEDESLELIENEHDVLNQIFDKLKTKHNFINKKKYSSSRNSIVKIPNKSNEFVNYRYDSTSILNRKQNNSFSFRKRKTLSEEKQEYKQLSIFANGKKLTKKVRLLRKSNIKVEKMDYINLFSYKRSKWNHYTLSGKESLKPFKHKKSQIKPSLPNFRHLSNPSKNINFSLQKTAENKEINVNDLMKDIDENQKKHKEMHEKLKIKEKEKPPTKQEVLHKLYQIALKTKKYAEICQKI